MVADRGAIHQGDWRPQLHPPGHRLRPPRPHLSLPWELSAELLLSHAFSDWRDVLPRLNVPTLVIGGDVSLFPTAGIRWLAAQMPGTELCIFSAEELGSHFLFWENSELFNTTVEDFLARTVAA